MAQIDYSKYTVEQLIDVQHNIDSNSANYEHFQRTMDDRKEEIEKYKEALLEQKFDTALNRIKVIGYLQLLAAIVIAINVLSTLGDASFSWLSLLVAIPLIGLNVFAGYTAVKEQVHWYWVSILNQSLQVISLGLGTITANYSGLGYMGVSLLQSDGIELKFSGGFSPGFAFQQYTEALQVQWVQIDILAILFIGALITVKSASAVSEPK